MRHGFNVKCYKYNEWQPWQPNIPGALHLFVCLAPLPLHASLSMLPQSHYSPRRPQAPHTHLSPPPWPLSKPRLTASADLAGRQADNIQARRALQGAQSSSRHLGTLNGSIPATLTQQCSACRCLSQQVCVQFGLDDNNILGLRHKGQQPTVRWRIFNIVFLDA